MPKGVRWVRSDAFDREVTGGTYAGTFSLDPGTDTVYFDTTNPSVAASTGRDRVLR